MKTMKISPFLPTFVWVLTTKQIRMVRLNECCSNRHAEKTIRERHWPLNRPCWQIGNMQILSNIWV